MMTTASTGAMTTSLPRSRWNGPTSSESFQPTLTSSSPSAIAEAAMAGRLVSRPSIDAASALK